MPEVEGNPVKMDINNSWLCTVTANGFICIYDMSAGYEIEN